MIRAGWQGKKLVWRAWGHCKESVSYGSLHGWDAVPVRIWMTLSILRPLVAGVKVLADGCGRSFSLRI